MNLDLIIGKLLLRNNCVIVPKFGGFIANQTAAFIDFSKENIFPPKKSILFNKQLTNNDGLLISTFALENNLSYLDAVEKIDQEIKIWQEELNSGKRIEFEKVGFLYLDNENNIHFEQDRFFNLLLQSFGMGQVQFIAESNIPIKEKKIKPDVLSNLSEKMVSVEPWKEKQILETPIIQLVSSTKKVEKENSKFTTKKLVKYIAAACLLPITFYSVWIPMKTDILESGMISLKDFNLFKKEQKATYQAHNLRVRFNKIPQVKSLEQQIFSLPKEVNIYSMEVNDEVFFVRIREGNQQNLPQGNLSKNSTNKNNFSKIAKSKSSKRNFQVIVGSFSNQDNAQYLAEELKAKGFHAYIFPRNNGLIRVSAGQTENNHAAQELVQKLSANQIPAWILK